MSLVPEQLRLCNDWLGGTDMAVVRARLDDLRSSRHSAKTVSAYLGDWTDFAGWCQSVGRAPMPADPETVALYLSHLEPDHKCSTLERRVAAIRYQHLAAGVLAPITPMVRSVLAGARRKTTKRAAQKAAITVAELLQISKLLMAERTVKSSRDRAILLLGFASAMRRSELASLDLSDISLREDRVSVSLGRSKTDQQGRGRSLVIPLARRAVLCPVRALRVWLTQRGSLCGPLFQVVGRDDEPTGVRIKGDLVYYVLRSAAERAGMDWRKFGAHSLRSGAVTAAADTGADVFEIMSLTGHKSVENVAKYVRRAVPRYALRSVL